MVTLTLTDLSDRERLAAAFDDLRQRGYAAPVEFAWEMCCSSCGGAELDRRGVGDRFVFWHVQSDDWAFYGDHAIPFPDATLEAMGQDDVDPEDGDGIDTWMAEHADEVSAQMLADRLAHGTLINSLFLQWGGDRHLICSVLAEHGLTVVKPPNGRKTVEIRATGPIGTT